MDLPLPAFPRALMHPFVHAGWFHLAVNMLSLWLMRRGRTWRDWVPSFAIASLAWLVCAPLMHRTPVGLSNMLMALAGMSAAGRRGWWRSRWLATVVFVMLVQLPFPGFSTATHAASLALGAAWGALRREWRRNEMTYGKVRGHSKHNQ